MSFWFSANCLWSSRRRKANCSSCCFSNVRVLPQLVQCHHGDKANQIFPIFYRDPLLNGNFTFSFDIQAAVGENPLQCEPPQESLHLVEGTFSVTEAVQSAEPRWWKRLRTVLPCEPPAPDRLMVGRHHSLPSINQAWAQRFAGTVARDKQAGCSTSGRKAETLTRWKEVLPRDINL